MMTRTEIDGIATDATNLLDALKGLQVFNDQFCYALLTAAMPAIVTANTAGQENPA